MVHNSNRSFVKSQAVKLAKAQGKSLVRKTLGDKRVWLLQDRSFDTIAQVLQELKKDA